MPVNLLQSLEVFYKTHRFSGKGALCVALVVTEHARNKRLPLDIAMLLTARQGQVLGLGRSLVQAILKRHDIVRVLAEEGGRTSRGNIDNMQTYVAFLNKLYEETDGAVDINAVERFWVEKVILFFAGKPFSFKLDAALSLRAVIRNLMAQAEHRQKEVPGVHFLGTMMQHLVGAKLEIILPAGTLSHHCSSQNDQRKDRTGDFDIEDISIHITTAPGEALIRKCVANLAANRKPVIISTSRGSQTAEGLAENADIAQRVDIIEFEQFIATNIFEIGHFRPERRRLVVDDLISRYNAIIDECETDPSLRINLVGGK